MKILVAGGAGYIGTHTCVELLNKGYDIIVYDNLSNSKIEAIKRVEQITGKSITFVKGDVLDERTLSKVFEENKIDAVINFAGLKAVAESIQLPLDYYQNNISGAISLLKIMKKYNCKNFIFSSSATVYGDPKVVPVDENSEVGGTTNPYGTTKLFIERIIMDYCKIDGSFNAAILRYFNPVGAHPTGLIGEDPNGIPNNLTPFITQVMVNKLPILSVFGDNYDTKDGTCVRDYIHVCDLAYGHVLALEKLLTNSGLVIYNLGTGNGLTVFEVIKAFERVSNVEIPYQVVDRRDGDVPRLYAKVDKAFEELGFKARYTIDDMARDSWNWQKKNPNGYE